MIWLIFIMAAAKYLYQALSLAPFEIDQEFLALEAWQFLKQANPTLIGAHTSAGDIFIGPFYTYFVTLVMWLTKLNPWPINILSALWAIAAVISLYFIGRQLFSRATGIIAALLAATSISYLNLTPTPPLVIPLSLISLLTFYCLSQLHLHPRLFLVTIILAGIGLNLHFTGLYLLAFIIIWILAHRLKFPLSSWLKAGLILLAFLSPLILFDLRHQFLNSRNFINFLLTTNSLKVVLNTLWRSLKLSLSNFGALTNNFQIYNLAFGSLISFSFLIYFLRLPVKTIQLKLLLAWTIFPMLVNGLYAGGLLPYYYTFHHAQIFLILGLLLEKLVKNQWGITTLLTLFLLYNFLNWRWHFQQSKGFSLTHKLAAFEFVKTHASTTNINLSFTVDHSRRGGLDFLRRYYGFDDQLLPQRPTYTIVIPHFFHRLKADADFGEIGIILPQKP